MIRPVGGRVQHHGVVLDGALVAAVALHRLVDLAGEQHVAHTRRDGGRELDHPEAVERPAGPAEPVVHGEVLQQRRLGVDVQRVHHSGGLAVAGQPRRDPALGVGQRVHVEHPGDALAALDLAEQHVLAVRGQRQRERRGDGRLAGAALAGHHVQAHVRPVAHGGTLLSELSSAASVADYCSTMGPRALVGRAREMAALTAFLDEQGPGGLVVTGEPGLGKSALWEYAADLATERGAVVLRATPGEGEQRHSFGVLHDLFRDTDLDGHRLRGPVREALAAVLLREAVTSPVDATARRGRRPRPAGRPRRGPPGGGVRGRRPVGRLRFAPGSDLRRSAAGPGARSSSCSPGAPASAAPLSRRRSPAGTCARSSHGRSASRRPRGCSGTTWTSR